MKEIDFCTKVLLENATHYREKNMIIALESEDKTRIDATMLNNLFTSVVNKAHVDFGSIPHSAGDIEKYSEYKQLIEVLDNLAGVAQQSGINITELAVINDALGNLRAYKDTFINAYKMEKDILVMQYNVLVAACIESTSLIVASYMDFIRRIDKGEFTIIKNIKKIDGICFDSLNRFNKVVKTGEFAKFASTILAKEGFIGTETLLLSTLFIGAAISVVPITRELVFYYYYSRMNLSDYLKQQAIFLELNKPVVQSSAKTMSEKKNIIKKQEALAKAMTKLSDKIKVNHKVTNVKTEKDVKDEQKSWSLDNLKSATMSGGSISLL